MAGVRAARTSAIPVGMTNLETEEPKNCPASEGGGYKSSEEPAPWKPQGAAPDQKGKTKKQQEALDRKSPPFAQNAKGRAPSRSFEGDVRTFADGSEGPSLQKKEEPEKHSQEWMCHKAGRSSCHGGATRAAV